MVDENQTAVMEGNHADRCDGGEPDRHDGGEPDRADLGKGLSCRNYSYHKLWERNLGELKSPCMAIILSFKVLFYSFVRLNY